MRRALALAPLLLLAACGPRVVWTGHDAARAHHARLIDDGDAQWLELAGAPQPRFDAIGPDGIVFSPDGRALAYPALRGARWVMITPTGTLGPYDGVTRPVFSPDGQRLAFVAESTAGLQVIVDGEAHPAFEHVQWDSLQFSASGAHLAYVAGRGACAMVVVDGVPGACHARVLALGLADTGTIAAVVRDGGRPAFVHGAHDAAAQDDHDEITSWALDPGGRAAYAARTGKDWTVFLDGAPTGPCTRPRALVFGDDGRRVAWLCSEGTGVVPVIDGRARGAFPSVSALALSAHAPHHAYATRDEHGAYVVTDTSTRGPYAHVSALVIADHGPAVAFVARVGGATKVVHGDRETPAGLVVDGSLVLTPDGAHWAAILGDTATRTLWIAIDGARHRDVAPAELFGDAELLGSWMQRELREALAP